MYTDSENLFEQFCRKNGIGYRPILKAQDPTADYELESGPHGLIAEISELTENDHDQHLTTQLKAGRVVIWSSQAYRIGRKIKSESPQLMKSLVKQQPGILVLYNNRLVGWFDGEDIRAAMFGHETIREINGQYFSGVDGRGKIKSGEHGHISAVCHLRSSLILDVYHNPFAKFPLNPNTFWRDSISHFWPTNDRLSWIRLCGRRRHDLTDLLENG